MVKIALSFDDGRRDNYDVVVPILQKYGLKATFNIATAYVDGTIPKDLAPCINPAMDKKHIKKLYLLGYEIAGHGDCHTNKDEDIIAGIRKLRNWLELEEYEQVGFASPRSDLSCNQILKHIDEYKAQRILYVRTGIFDGNSFIKKIERKLAYLTGNKMLYYKAFEKSIGLIKRNFLIYSIPIMNRATLKQVIYLIRKAVKNGKGCVLMFHSIADIEDLYYKDTWSWDRNKFIGLCRWLGEQEKLGKLEIVTTADFLEESVRLK